MIDCQIKPLFFFPTPLPLIFEVRLSALALSLLWYLFDVLSNLFLTRRLPFLRWQMQRPAEASDGDTSALSYVALRSGRIVAWWCLAEYMIHVMYMHAIQSNETYLEILPPWALGTLSFVRLTFSTLMIRRKNSKLPLQYF